MSPEDVGQLLEHRRQLHQVCTFISGAQALEELLSGAQGRILELLATDDRTRQASSRKAPVEEIRNLGVAAGMTTLLQDGVEKALAGLTDLKAVLPVASR